MSFATCRTHDHASSHWTIPTAAFALCVLLCGLAAILAPHPLAAQGLGEVVDQHEEPAGGLNQVEGAVNPEPTPDDVAPSPDRPEPGPAPNLRALQLLLPPWLGPWWQTLLEDILQAVAALPPSGTPANASATPGTGSGTGPAPTTGTETATGTDTGTATGTAPGTTVASGSSGTEADFASRAARFSGPGWKPMGSWGGGDTAGHMYCETFGFAKWFGDLQQALIERTHWGPEEEEAQRLLADYAAWQARALNGGKLHSTFGYFFQYVGLSAMNNDAVRRYDWKVRRASNLGGDGSNTIWCAQASRQSFQKGLDGYRFIPGAVPAGQKSWGSFGDWLNYGKGRKFMERGPQARDGLAGGDIVTLGDMSKPGQPDKHVATVIGVRGDKLLVVSGNAGGAPKGTVRVEEVPLAAVNLVERYSRLDREKVDAMSDQELAEVGLARKTS